MTLRESACIPFFISGMEVLLKNYTLNETYLEMWHAKSKFLLSDMARVNSRFTGEAGSNIMQYFASHFVLCLIYPIFAKDKLRLGIAFK